ncbi:MAG TPA: DNRLRE domain-containing protein [Syntrophomonadaceae bacterium]|nr:DNRLRE domain-containing protein [Syntrophomonadaceae bacterium]
MAMKRIYPNKNIYVAKYYPRQNFAYTPYLYLSQYRQPGDIYRTLMQFSLRCIPRHHCIDTARLHLTMYRNEIPPGLVVRCGLKRVLEPWLEKCVTWNSQPPSKLATSFTACFTDRPGTVLSKDVTHLVRSWYKGRKRNHGIVLTGDEFQNSLIGLYSTNYPDWTVWPYLEVHYHKARRTRCARRHRTHRHRYTCRKRGRC